MGKAKIKRVLTLAASCLAVLLVIDAIAGGFVDPTGANAAIAACKEKGRQDVALGKSRSTVPWWFFGQSATVELKTSNRNPPKTIRVTLQKWLNLLGWEVIDYKEE
jgi:hypothetical protein